MTPARRQVLGRDGCEGVVRDTQPFIVIELWGDRYWNDCPMCGQLRRMERAVAWYCEPVHVEIGAPVPEWGPDAVAGGMSVCRPCHDDWYGLAASEAECARLRGEGEG